MGKRWMAVVVGALIVLAVAAFFAPMISERSGPPDPLLSRMHDLWVATNVYAADKGGFPDLRSPDALKAALMPKYLNDSSKFVNPHTDLPIDINPTLSFVRGLNDRKPGEDVILFFGPRADAEEPMAALFLNGVARPLSDTEWRALRRSSRLR